MKISKFVDQSLLFAVLRKAKTVERGLAVELKPYGVGHTEALCLVSFFVDESGDVRLGRLARVLEITPTMMSNCISRLESSGYLRRKIHPGDKRKFEFTLTEKGRRIAPKLVQVFDRFDLRLEKSVDRALFGAMMEFLRVGSDEAQFLRRRPRRPG